MKVKSVERIGKHNVYDISVRDEENYVLENGVITHNTGPMYSANNVFIVGKRQIKEGKDVIGWQFILNVEKSRTIREKSAIPFEVLYGSGLDTYSGLLDIAIATGHVVKPKMGWYARANVEDDKNWRRKETSTTKFWDPILKDTTFNEAVKSMYCFGGGDPLLQSKIDDMLNDGEELDEDTGEILNSEE